MKPSCQKSYNPKKKSKLKLYTPQPSSTIKKYEKKAIQRLSSREIIGTANMCPPTTKQTSEPVLGLQSQHKSPLEPISTKPDPAAIKPPDVPRISGQGYSPNNMSTISSKEPNLCQRNSSAMTSRKGPPASHLSQLSRSTEVHGGTTSPTQVKEPTIARLSVVELQSLNEWKADKATAKDPDSLQNSIRTEGINNSHQNVMNLNCESAGSFRNEYAMNENPTCLPATRVCWAGTFEILPIAWDIPSQFYAGIQAHQSPIAAVQVCEILKKMPEQLELQMLSRSKVWPEIFRIVPPNKNDIGVYFFPCDHERFRRSYNLLLNWIDAHDLALRSNVSDVELLIFSSKQLTDLSKRQTEDPQSFDGYLWGVFRKLNVRTNIVSAENVGAV